MRSARRTTRRRSRKMARIPGIKPVDPSVLDGPTKETAAVNRRIAEQAAPTVGAPKDLRDRVEQLEEELIKAMDAIQILTGRVALLEHHQEVHREAHRANAPQLVGAAAPVTRLPDAPYPMDTLSGLRLHGLVRRPGKGQKQADYLRFLAQESGYEVQSVRYHLGAGEKDHPRNKLFDDWREAAGTQNLLQDEWALWKLCSACRDANNGRWTTWYTATLKGAPAPYFELK
jgi:hypothetical protein